jgi:Cytochrome oxidase assembly protein
MMQLARQQFNLLVSKRSHSSIVGKSKRTFNANLGFKENPIIFNKINENYVIKGKEKLVGWWLMGVGVSVFSIIILGGYTRLSRSGLSMVKWHPHKIGLPKG